MRFLSMLLRPFVVTAVLVFFVIAWVVWGSLNFPETLWAPGDLSRYHSNASGCSDCHQPFKGATSEKCVMCHDGNQFAEVAKMEVVKFHQEIIRERKACSGCHTEHRGTFAQITIGALKNPHGEFVFSATGARACTSCHELDKNFEIQGQVLNNAIVELLMLRGEGKHRAGKMSNCSRCHAG